jgi:hypothetical protein
MDVIRTSSSYLARILAFPPETWAVMAERRSYSMLETVCKHSYISHTSSRDHFDRFAERLLEIEGVYGDFRVM